MNRTHLSLLLLGLAALTGCSRDADGDGYKSNVDCDDSDDRAYPDRTETCDGIDNDCDGEIDEGVLSTWYIDADGDGYGSADYTTKSCGQPEGYVANNDDCDDTSADIHPGAEETDCTDPTDYNCDGSVGFEDADGDGYAACEDCDDASADVHPDADELCNEIDDDCDGEIDDAPIDAPEWFIDYDHDGYGSASYSLTLCDQPAGYVADDTDCDDTDPTAHPGGDEVCDGVDNDCDGTIDGEDALDVVTVYPDADGDGFGDPAGETRVCEVPSDYVTDASDCDDGNDAVNPDATEICDDGIDNDCDGGSTGCELVVDDGFARIVGENPDDRAGLAFSAASDVNADGVPDLLVGAWQHDAGSEGLEGAAYVLLGPISAGDTILSDADLTLLGTTGDGRAGYTVAGVGDMDGDGVDDIVVGAIRSDEAAPAAGTAYFLSGANVGSAAPGDAWDLSDADHLWTGSRGSDWLAAWLEPLGDMDGDGFTDLLIGATGADGGGSSSGEVYVIRGSATLPDGETGVAADVAAATIWGEDDANYLGAIGGSPGDLDGDGVADLVVASEYNSAGGTEAGAVYVILGPVSGDMGADDADARLLGEAGDHLGSAFAWPGDVDGDGFADLWVGANRVDTGAADGGAVFFLAGTATPADWAEELVADVASVTVLAEDAGEGVGRSVASDDLDGDGVADLLVGANQAGLNGEGRAYLFLGPLSGTISAGSRADAWLVGDEPSDAIGTTVAILGDVAGTGAPMLGIASWKDDANGTDAGTVFLAELPGL